MAFVKKEGTLAEQKKAVSDYFKPIKHQKVALKIASIRQSKERKDSLRHHRSQVSGGSQTSRDMST